MKLDILNLFSIMVKYSIYIDGKNFFMNTSNTNMNLVRFSELPNICEQQFLR